jgi:hypothetical protein
MRVAWVGRDRLGSRLADSVAVLAQLLGQSADPTTLDLLLAKPGQSVQHDRWPSM